MTIETKNSNISRIIDNGNATHVNTHTSGVDTSVSPQNIRTTDGYQGINNKTHEQNVQKLSSLWRELDANQNSSISRNEVEKFVQNHNLAMDSAQFFVETLDSNLNQEIDLREFSALEFETSLFKMFTDAINLSTDSSVDVDFSEEE